MYSALFTRHFRYLILIGRESYLAWIMQWYLAGCLSLLVRQ
jgi:hypothetical protein